METYLSRDFIPSQDAMTKILFVGMRGTNHERLKPENDAVQDRLEKALVIIDDPYLKSVKILRMMKGLGLVNWQDNYYLFREEISKLLTIWVKEGLDSAVLELLKISKDKEWNTSVCLATRFASFLPEAPEDLISNLLQHLLENKNLTQQQRAFLSLTIAEKCENDISVLYELVHC